MKAVLKKYLLLLTVGISFFAHASPLKIVAAENFYGDLAKEIGGPYVQVINIMSNPNQDPHLFSASPATAEAIANADMVVYSGIAYDPWMVNLLQANKKQPKVVIIVADLIHKKIGNNPHIWYDPQTMPAYVANLSEKLSQLDPDHANYFKKQTLEFNKSYDSVTQLIKTIRDKYKGTPLIATEPVFGYMADALGLNVYDQGFQLSMMNNTEPSAADIREFEEKLQNHQVKALIYNNQVIDPLTERMKNLAIAQKIPVVGVSETQPIEINYIKWMLQELLRLQQALAS